MRLSACGLLLILSLHAMPAIESWQELRKQIAILDGYLTAAQNEIASLSEQSKHLETSLQRTGNLLGSYKRTTRALRLNLQARIEYLTQLEADLQQAKALLQEQEQRLSESNSSLTNLSQAVEDERRAADDQIFRLRLANGVLIGVTVATGITAAAIIITMILRK